MSRREGQGSPRYGEVWKMEGEGAGGPFLGLVVSTDAIAPLPIRIIAQIEQEGEPAGLWHVPAPGTTDSGLSRGAFIDTARLCTVEEDSWGERVGRMPADFMGEIAAAIAILVEFEE